MNVFSAPLKDMAKWFAYLDTLRESGATNMFGSVPYLRDRFDLSRDDASKVLSLWMKTFDDSDPEDRARRALES